MYSSLILERSVWSYHKLYEKENNTFKLAFGAVKETCGRRLHQQLQHLSDIRAYSMASSNPTASPAPWKSLFLEHVSKQEDPYMAVATVQRDPKNGSSIPRVRYCGFRGFFGELKLHHSAEKQLKEENEMNPSVYESDLLAFTTDVRMQKIEQFGDFEGAIEVVFWVKELMAQWRLRGKAFVIGDDANKSAEKESRAEVSKALMKKQNHSESSAEEWTWEKEVTAYFANHSPIMRGVYTIPAPTPALHDN